MKTREQRTNYEDIKSDLRAFWNYMGFNLLADEARFLFRKIPKENRLPAVALTVILVVMVSLSLIFDPSIPDHEKRYRIHLPGGASFVVGKSELLQRQDDFAEMGMTFEYTIVR